MALVLVVDDDPGVRSSLEGCLGFEGYDVVTASDGGEALGLISRRPPDVIVLDVGLPYVDGLQVCRRIRAMSVDIPILLLTARAETDDRVTGLDAGADDYLVKPFALDELLARLRALLRRAQAAEPVQLAFAGIEMNTETRLVSRDGFPLDLTRIEFDILEFFLRQPRFVHSREVLLREIWGTEVDPGSNTLNVFVSYLRRKLEAGDRPRLIHNIRGVGYILRAPM